ncbi:uncharacterized protein LOC122310236 [Carya illinoinensis]|uniref:uncharacterized protein LOC122310236 n=1 Tax=Carya illinoinensis TaxID=32201 RepID=UPI001C7283A0|nr:uncharacterized protein LOC122310236 [Carya illinoinensis]
MTSKEGYMASKLDMSKAYDRIEWSFLRVVLYKLGFCNKWVELVIRCIETVSYAILVNGTPLDFFQPTRGIRQHDPLSPYLFIMCAEALSNLINKAEDKGLIHGVPMAKASGQRLNLEKTSIIFSKNTAKMAQQYILSIAGVRTTMTYEKYLGLPSMVGRSKWNSFKGILDKFRSRISSYKIKLMSKAGKEIHIKAVLQALPSYTMSVFNLPKSLLKDINSVIHNFWWGQQEREHKIHWVSWKRMSKAKAERGMGFRDLEVFNKQCWQNNAGD